MARRIILGRNGGTFQFRVSAAGYDAATAQLDGILFDGDYIPARVAASGTFRVPKGTNINVPGEASRSHGLAGIAMAMAIARPWDDVLNEPGDWYYFLGLPPGQGGGVGGYRLDNSRMDAQYVTPFYWDGDSLQGETYQCGWKFFWDGSQVTARNYTLRPLDVRWAALEF